MCFPPLLTSLHLRHSVLLLLTAVVVVIQSATATYIYILRILPNNKLHEVLRNIYVTYVSHVDLCMYVCMDSIICCVDYCCAVVLVYYGVYVYLFVKERGI